MNMIASLISPKPEETKALAALNENEMGQIMVMDCQLSNLGQVSARKKVVLVMACGSWSKTSPSLDLQPLPAKKVETAPWRVESSTNLLPVAAMRERGLSLTASLADGTPLGSATIPADAFLAAAGNVTTCEQPLLFEKKVVGKARVSAKYRSQARIEAETPSLAQPAADQAVAPVEVAAAAPTASPQLVEATMHKLEESLSKKIGVLEGGLQDQFKQVSFVHP
jgi:hypothetical protein